MEKKKLLLAEGNEELAISLEDALRGLYNLRACRDGQTALQLMHSFKPDILVLDLMLPGLDGISLLQNITSEHLEPMVLATSRYYNDYMLDAMTRYQVGYLIVKPCDVRATIARIGDLTTRISPPQPTRPDPRNHAANLLRDFRVPSKLKGFRYLREAVVLMAEDPDQAITKELYTKVADLFNTGFKQVERCIRTAIEDAWEVRDEHFWRMYFAPGQDGFLEKPSNAEFICRLADCLSCGDNRTEER